MARFLVDESLPRAVTVALAAAGHDTADARDVGLRGAPDAAVASAAKAQSRIVVAGDTDFANALRFPPGSHPGIIVLRLPNDWTPAERAQRLMDVLVAGVALSSTIVIVEPTRVRVLSPPESQQ